MDTQPMPKIRIHCNFLPVLLLLLLLLSTDCGCQSAAARHNTSRRLLRGSNDLSKNDASIRHWLVKRKQPDTRRIRRPVRALKQRRNVEISAKEALDWMMNHHGLEENYSRIAKENDDDYYRDDNGGGDDEKKEDDDDEKEEEDKNAVPNDNENDSVHVLDDIPIGGGGNDNDADHSVDQNALPNAFDLNGNDNDKDEEDDDTDDVPVQQTLAPTSKHKKHRTKTPTASPTIERSAMPTAKNAMTKHDGGDDNHDDNDDDFDKENDNDNEMDATDFPSISNMQTFEPTPSPSRIKSTHSPSEMKVTVKSTTIPSISPTAEVTEPKDMTQAPTRPPSSMPTLIVQEETNSPSVSPTIPLRKISTHSPTLNPTASITTSATTLDDPTNRYNGYDHGGMDDYYAKEENSQNGSGSSSSSSGSRDDIDWSESSSSSSAKGDEMLDRIYDALSPEEIEYLKHHEFLDQEKEAAKISALYFVITLVLMVFTAHQLSENPDGVYSNMCRLAITVSGCVLKIVLLPFRKICGFGTRQGYSHHLVSNDPYFGGESSHRMEIM